MSFTDQLTKDWLNSNAGFDEFKKSVQLSKKNFSATCTLKTTHCDNDSEAEEKEVEIDWSSSSEDENKGAKCIRTVDVRARQKMGALQRKLMKSAPHSSSQRGKTLSTWSEKRSSVSRKRTLDEVRGSNAEDCVISDSESSSDGIVTPPQTAERTDTVISSKPGTCVRGKTVNTRRESPSVNPRSAIRERFSATSEHHSRGKKRKNAAGSAESFEPEILDYDSPTEESLDNEVQSSIGTPNISNPSSFGSPLGSRDRHEHTSPGLNPMGSPRTGSEWMKKLRLQSSVTPEKTSRADAGLATRPGSATKTTGAAGNVDSTRKKKKFVRSGLAERLQRLVSREKSSIAMWHHNQSDSQNSQQERNRSVMVVRVLSFETCQGLYLTRCLTRVSCGSNVNNGSNGHGGSSKVTRGGEDEKGGIGEDQEMLVFFSKTTGDQFRLTRDMLVSIHAPWQKLSISNIKDPVILCTHFCRPLTSDLDDSSPTLSQNLPVFHENLRKSSTSPKGLNPVRLFPSASPTTTSAALSVVHGATNQDGWRKSVSQSIMESVSETGGCTSSGISFKARVQRIVLRRQQQSARMTSKSQNQPHPSSTHIRSLLLQDRHGVVCELQLTNQTAESTTWQQVLQSGEGKAYIFMKLRVTQRQPMARAPGLFSLIGSLQDSESSLNGHQTFCYILTSELGVTGVKPLGGSELDDVPPYKPPTLQDLSDIVKIPDGPTRRTTFHAISIHFSAATHESTRSSSSSSLSSVPSAGGWLLFLSTPSLLQQHHSSQGEQSTSLCDEAGGSPNPHIRGIPRPSHGEGLGVCLLITQSHVMDVDVLNGLQSGRRQTVQCRDVMMASGPPGMDTIADGFSLITLTSETEHKSLPSLRLPTLNVMTRSHSLVKVTGNICGVEEESAYSWPACPKCSNNHLEGGEGSGCVLHCSVCNEDVCSPLTRIHLVVLIRCPNLPPNLAVKVQLLQTTIESLLSSSSPSSKGHDLQSIMGVLIGPISCLVRSVCETSGQQIYFVEEILLQT